MEGRLKDLAEIVAKANDDFHDKHKNISTLMGIVDESLRKQGMAADAITVECVKLDKKIVILIFDDKLDFVDVALGNRAGEIFSSDEHVLEDLTQARVIEIMEQSFCT